MVDTNGYAPADFAVFAEGLETFVRTIDTQFQVHPEGTHIGITSYNDKDGPSILNLNEGTSITTVFNAIQSIQPSDDVSSTSSLLNGLISSRNDFQSNSRVSTTPHEPTVTVVVAFVNSPYDKSDSDDTIEIANILKTEHVYIHVISVSPDLELPQLGSIASDPENVVFEPIALVSTLWREPAVLMTMLCPKPSKLNCSDVADSRHEYIHSHRKKGIQVTNRLLIEHLLVPDQEPGTICRRN